MEEEGDNQGGGGDKQKGEKAVYREGKAEGKIRVLGKGRENNREGKGRETIREWEGKALGYGKERAIVYGKG